MSYLAQYDAVPPADARQRIALASRWIRTDSRAFFAELRERRPIFRTPAFTLVTRFHDVASVLERNHQFSVRLYAMKMDEVVGPFMLGRDNAVQNQRDKALMHLVLPLSDQERIRSVVREATLAVLSDEAGEIDVVKSVSRIVPVRLCGDYFGFQGPDDESMLRWSKATQSDFFKNIGNDLAIHAAAVAAGREMKAYLSGLIKKRQAAIEADPSASCTGGTAVDRVIRLSAASDDLCFDDEALLSNIAGLLVGTVETASQAVAQALQQILLRPQVRDQGIKAALDDDRETLSAIVWEALRFNPINPLLFRYTEEDTMIGEGTVHAEMISKGTVVFACTASAMWDETVIEHADEFRVNRPSFSKIHFGYGSHECLGKFVGEITIPEIIRALLERKAALPEGSSGEIDFEGGAFPESFRVTLETSGN